MACALLLAGCGTNVKGLLNKQGKTFWEAEQLTDAADAQQSEQLTAVLAAEKARTKQCRTIDSAVMDRMQQPSLPFWEQLWSDLTQLIALIVPIPTVERCAQAHDDYYEALDRLRDSLQAEPLRSDLRPLPRQIGRAWPAAEDQLSKGR